MIFEVLPTQFDVTRLVQYLHEHVLHLEPMLQSEAFGGWSVLSSNRSYKDGWHQGHKTMKKDASLDEVRNGLKNMGAKRSSEYAYPTEIYTGYMKEVIENISSMGLNPRRARIIRLTAGLASSWHRDAPEHFDFVRLHIPIITNFGCFFETESGRDHMSANGQSYFVRVNRLHRVVNEGQTDRFHLVMDVYDQNGVSQYHRPPANAVVKS